MTLFEWIMVAVSVIGIIGVVGGLFLLRQIRDQLMRNRGFLKVISLSLTELQMHAGEAKNKDGE